MTDPRVRPSPVARIAWLTAGWLFFAIGVVGILLPGLPSTAPMLVAVACFARGSERLHRWLLDHRWFGPPLRRWQEHRVITPRAKVTALLMMTGSLTYLIWFSGLSGWLLGVTIAFLLLGMVVVSRIPHRPESPGHDRP